MRELRLFFFLAFPSLGLIQKYFGLAGVGLYLLFVFLMTVLGFRGVFNRFLAGVTEKRAVWLAGLAFLLLLILFSFLFPLANTGIFGGGSDSDDDLDLSVRNLLAGQYPYYGKTYLENELTFFPGALLLALPFVVLGTSAYQNFFWLPVLFGVIQSIFKSRRKALLLFWTVLALSPYFVQSLVTGYTGLANSIYVLLASFWVLRVIPQEERGGRKVLAAVFLGIALSSRMNYLLCLPLVFSALVQNAGWRQAVQYTLLSVLIFMAVSLPFYLQDPAGFTPLHAQWSRLERFRYFVPHVHFVVAVIALLISLAFCFSRMGRDGLAFFRNCAVVQIFPVLAALFLYCLRSGDLRLIWTGYGIHFLFFGVIGFWPAGARFSEKTEENLERDN